MSPVEWLGRQELAVGKCHWGLLAVWLGVMLSWLVGLSWFQLFAVSEVTQDWGAVWHNEDKAW